MWRSKTRLGIRGALYGTLILVVFAKASPSGFTKHNVFETFRTSHIVGNSDRKNFTRGSRGYPTNSNMWRGIRPLVSTRAEVERLLGAPTDSLRQTVMYENNTDKVDVLYSESACGQTAIGRWNVPKDTVLKIKVIPQSTLLVKDLRFDKSKYKKIREVHPQNWIHYFNADVGITVDAEVRGGREEVMSVVYEPSSRQENLRCSKDGRSP